VSAHGGSGLSGVDVGEGLGAGHLTPDVPRAQLAEVDLVLHQRLGVLHVVVHQRHGHHAGHGGDGRERDAEEGERLETLGLVAAGELVAVVSHVSLL
jgi:hypothetical protein